MSETRSIPVASKNGTRELPSEPIFYREIEATSNRKQSSVRRRAGKELSEMQCGRIYAYLEFDWKPSAIARKMGVSESVVNRIEQNLRTYGTIRPPQVHTRGRRHSMTLADEDALLKYLLNFGWRCQDENGLLVEGRERCDS